VGLFRQGDDFLEARVAILFPFSLQAKNIQAQFESHRFNSFLAAATNDSAQDMLKAAPFSENAPI